MKARALGEKGENAGRRSNSEDRTTILFMPIPFVGFVAFR
jgi:hypothetical protein